jgi:hypothetical protein
LPAEFDIWKVDEKGIAENTPDKGIATVAGEQGRTRRSLEVELKKEREKTEKATADLDKMASEYKSAVKTFTELAKTEPEKFAKNLAEAVAKYD